MQPLITVMLFAITHDWVCDYYGLSACCVVVKGPLGMPGDRGRIGAPGPVVSPDAF